LTLAGSGPATAVHIAFEMFKRAAKVDMIFVPYPGGAPAVTALLDHVTSVLADYAGMAEQKSSCPAVTIHFDSRAAWRFCVRIQ
jgi:tripartite-type tricarboxylate transporter receptor subunit TctC